MNIWLIIAGLLSLLAAILHLVIIYFGTPWYKFFGAGKKIVQMSKEGSVYPAILTFAIASVLFIWALYAFSGAGLIATLPGLQIVLLLITSIYVLRGLAVIPLYILIPRRVDKFMVWSSVISLMFGLVHLIAII